MTAARKPRAVKPAVSPERRRLLAQVHLAKKALGLDDDAYRAKLKGHTGAESAADLDDLRLRDVIRAWSRDLPAEARGRVGASRRGGLKEPFQRLVRALWISLYNLGEVDDGSDAALDAFVSRQVRVSALRFLRAHDATSVVEALRDWLARAGVDDGVVGEIDSRVAVVRAQWRRLADWGATRVAHEGGLSGWMHGRVTPGRRAVDQLSTDQLDDAIRQLGDWIRAVKARRTAS